MPEKSIETHKAQPRNPKVRLPPPVPTVVAYLNFSEVIRDAGRLPRPWCLLECDEKHLEVGLLDASHVKLRVTVCEDFSIKVRVYDFESTITGTIEYTKISNYLSDLSKQKICPEIVTDSLLKYAALPEGAGQAHYYKHVTNYSVGPDGFMHCTSCIRAVTCELLLDSSKNLCLQCAAAKQLILKKQTRAERNASKPLNRYEKLTCASKERISRTLKEIRKKEKLLEREVERFRRECSSESVEVEESMHNGLKTVMENAEIEDPLTKLFWQEQSKAFKTHQYGMRWHPTMIRLAILLHSRSPGGYDTLRNLGIVKLPGESTLKDYTNVIKPQSGFNKPALEEIHKQTKDLKEEERFVVLLHDEMTIKADLVFDRRSGKIIGFMNPDRWTKDAGENLATHALVFFVVGINSDVRVSLGFFGTATATAGELYPLLWQAIGYLETESRLKVIASTSDKASANQKLYQLHQKARENEVCFKTINMFAPDRFVYFFSDPPHLIKTVRNNLANSGSGKKTNYLWCRGHDILWQHVRNVYNVDSAEGKELRHTKLTNDHVNLTSSSVMNVRLAAQVFSRSVGLMMGKIGDEAATETSRFILLMDRFFDCLNVRSVKEGKEKRKPDLNPYTDVDDPRFHFLENEFLGYLDDWKRSIAERPGPFSQQERSKMFLTHQTYKGLVMTVKAFCEATRYLLSSGVPYVLSNVFCQDPIEEHFGKHRGLGRRSDNPNLATFAQQEHKIRMQRGLAMALQTKGNFSAARRKRHGPVQISTSPLKKIKRK